MGNDFLRQQRVLPREVGKRGQDRLAESKDAGLLVEESVQEKGYARFLALGGAPYRGHAPRVVRGSGGVRLGQRGARTKIFIRLTLAGRPPPVRARPSMPLATRGVSRRSTTSNSTRVRRGGAWEAD